MPFYGLPRLLSGVDPPPPPEPFRYHFFVSYTTREEEVTQIAETVDEFVSELRSAGFSANPIFLDRAVIGRFSGGDPELASVLWQAIHDSLCMIAFVSPGYMNSPWCLFEWHAMHGATKACRAQGLPMILPIVWKELGEEHWAKAHDAGLHRLPERLRVMYPTYLHMFFPPPIELQAAESTDYFPMEVFADRLGWERAIRESADFLIDRSRITYNRPDDEPLSNPWYWYKRGDPDWSERWRVYKGGGLPPEAYPIHAPDRYPDLGGHRRLGRREPDW
jgi:hypothetical protein